jgi:hypothetical protein
MTTSRLGGGRASVAGMGASIATPFVSGNRDGLAVTARTPERNPQQIEDALRDGVAAFAAKLLDVIPPERRSGPESHKLTDIKRKRQHATPENMAFLLWMARRTNEPICLLSECVRLYEVEAAAAPICFYDLMEQETELEGSVNLVQAKAIRTKSRAYLMQLTELGPQMIAVWRRITDRAHHELARGA